MRHRDAPTGETQSNNGESAPAGAVQTIIELELLSAPRGLELGLDSLAALVAFHRNWSDASW